MNSPINWGIQANLDAFISSADVSNVFRAMDEHGISIPWLAREESCWNYLINNLRWDQVTLLVRLIDTYKATGEYPRFGVPIDGLMG